jgi:hypothetical protein
MNDPFASLLPAVLPSLQGPGSALARPTPARRALFSLAGERAAAWGTELRGVEEIQAAGWTLVSQLGTGLGPASNVIVGPRSVRREVAGAGGSVLETLLVPVDLPAAALQWKRPAGAPTGPSMRIAWRLRWRGPEPAAHTLLDGGLRVGALLSGESPARAPTALVALHPHPTRLGAEWHGGQLLVSADVQCGEDGAVTLLLAAGEEPEQAAGALRALRFLGAQEKRAEQLVAEAGGERISMRSGAASLDEGLEWAKARLSGVLSVRRGVRTLRRGGLACWEQPVNPAPDAFTTPSPLDPELEAVWIALGALAVGDPKPARVLLAGRLTTPYHLLVAARYGAWTGDVAALLPHRGAAQGLSSHLAARSGVPALAAAARELSDVFEALGERHLAGELRESASASSSRSGDWGRRLPMLGRGAPASDGGQPSLADALFGDAPRPYQDPVAPAGGGVERGLRAWAQCRAGDADQGGRALAEHARAGFQDGAGVWSEGVGVDGCRDHAASAAVLPAALLFGALGAHADAPVGRLRLAPRVPGGWRSLSVEGIPLGDARVHLHYERKEATHAFRVSQERGRTPIMLIFEPEVREEDLGEVLVDGAPAELDGKSGSGRTAVRVQLPLDRERSLTLIGGGVKNEAAASGAERDP